MALNGYNQEHLYIQYTENILIENQVNEEEMKWITIAKCRNLINNNTGKMKETVRTFHFCLSCEEVGKKDLFTKFKTVCDHCTDE